MTHKILLPLALCGAAACSDVTSPFALGKFASVSGGFEHTCALLGEGTLYCWGRNDQSQLGYGAGNARDTLPRLATTAETFHQVAAGEAHSCAISSAGAAYCWGMGFDGQLGIGAATQAPTPMPVAGTVRFSRIVAGKSHTCGLSLGGSAYCWGLNDFGVLGRDTTGARTPLAVVDGIQFVDVSAGDYHTCAVTTLGAGACWGSNAFGQAGSGDTTTNGVHVTPAGVAGGHVWSAISAGNAHSCGIAEGGVPYCWGANTVGMLGDGTQIESRVPVAVAGNHTFNSISVGAGQSCALTFTGELYCWGDNNIIGGVATATCDAGGPPIPCSLEPIRVAPGLNFRSIEVGMFHTCGVLLGGGAMCWGLNNRGQVGNGVAGTIVPTPTRVTDP